MTQPAKVCQLYFLFDPRADLPFYVGIGLPGRSKAHVSQTRNARYVKLKDLKKITIMKMLHEGITPVDRIIHDGLTKDEARLKEREYIAKFGRIDLGTGILTNRTSGGEWINDSPRTPEWRAKMSASQKITQNREDVRARKSRGLAGQKRTPEQIERIKASQMVDSVRMRNVESKIGGENPMARKCEFNGEIYGAVTEIVKETGISGYFLKKSPLFRYL